MPDKSRQENNWIDKMDRINRLTKGISETHHLKYSADDNESRQSHSLSLQNRQQGGNH